MSHPTAFDRESNRTAEIPPTLEYPAQRMGQQRLCQRKHLQLLEDPNSMLLSYYSFNIPALLVLII